MRIINVLESVDLSFEQFPLLSSDFIFVNDKNRSCKFGAPINRFAKFIELFTDQRRG